MLIGWAQEPLAPPVRVPGLREAPLGPDSLAGFPLVREASSMATRKAEEYRAKAREAEQLAEKTVDSTIKEQALKIAEQWRYMAAFEEKFGRP